MKPPAVAQAANNSLTANQSVAAIHADGMSNDALSLLLKMVMQDQ